MQDKNPNRYKAPIGESTLKLRDTLTGNKWWSINELIGYLQQPKAIIYNNLTRHAKKFNIESYVSLENGRNVKYYRIKQNDDI